MSWETFIMILVFILQVIFLVLVVLGGIILLAGMLVGLYRVFRPVKPTKTKVDNDPMI